MGLIRQTETATGGLTGGYAFDMTDIAAEAARMIEAARSEADRILESGRRERDELVSSAYDVGHQMGYQAGFAEGMQRGRAEGFEQTMSDLREGFSLLDASWNEALASFRELRGTMLEETRTDLVVLATEVAERVTKRYVELDENVASAQLREAIGLVLDRTKLVIEVNPADESACRAVLPKLMAEVQPDDHARLVTNSELRRGSVVIRTPKGFVDASIDTQVRRVVQALLRDRQRLIDEMDHSDAEPIATTDETECAAQVDFDALQSESRRVLGRPDANDEEDPPGTAERSEATEPDGAGDADGDAGAGAGADGDSGVPGDAESAGDEGSDEGDGA